MCKTTIKFICVVLVLGLARIAFAETEELEALANDGTSPTTRYETTETEKPKYKSFSLEAQVLTSTYSYEEPSKMKLSGTHYGVGGVARIATPILWQTYVGVSGEYLTGKPDYDGRNQLGQPAKSDSENTMTSVSGFVGRIFRADGYSTRFDTRLGIGYRYLDNQLKDGARDRFGMINRGYQREQEFWYVPMIFGVGQPITNNLALRAGFEFDYIWRGQNTAHFEDTNPTLSSVEFNQDSGYGFKVSGGVQYKIGPVRVVSELFYRVWDVEKSDSETFISQNGLRVSGNEPANKTSMTGVGLGVTF